MLSDTSTMKKIIFICVNYNNSRYTEKLIKSLEGQAGFDDAFLVSCVVVDNSTEVADSQRLSEFCCLIDWVDYLKSPSNLGYFGGLNLGLKQIAKDESSYIIICNNDLEFEYLFCEKLLNIKVSSNVFSICPDVITPEKFHQNPHVTRKINMLTRTKFDLYFSHYYIACALSYVKKILPVKKKNHVSAQCEIHMGIGACYILTENFLSHFNSLYFPFFLYGEEAFFSEQIHSKNGVLIYEPELKVLHAESATLSEIPKRTAYEFARKGYPRYRKLM